MKRVLITGGLGFLGSYAIEKFHEEGWVIDVIDNCSSNAIEKDDRIRWIYNMDCVDFVGSSSYDLILHLASPVGPSGIIKHAGKIASKIIEGVDWAKNIALKNDCPLVFISTSEIYGHRDGIVELKEDDDKILRGDFSVRNEYSMSKLVAEISLLNTARFHPLKYRIIRPFNISGARQQPDNGFVTPRFVQQALNGEPITVFGDGSDVRSLTHAKDIMSGIFLLANHSENGVWNVGTPDNKITMLDLAMMVVKLTNSKSEITLVDPKTIHGPHFAGAWSKVANCDKIGSLGWKAKYSTEDIVKDVIEYWRSK